MRDARGARRPALRLAEITAWDVLSLAFEGARAGQFKEGQSFQVSLLRIYLTGLAVLRQGLSFLFRCPFPLVRLPI